MGNWRDLLAYQKGFTVAMEIFKLAKTQFPTEEKYDLSSQIIRSSRSVCANIAEAYRKRKYGPHFASKLSDADAENTETQVWLDFAVACGYMSQEMQNDLMHKTEETGRLLHHMMGNPEKYGAATCNPKS